VRKQFSLACFNSTSGTKVQREALHPSKTTRAANGFLQDLRVF
jgi:hypothetical protein